MIVNLAGVSSLAYDMYKDTITNPYDEEGKPIITKEQWDKYWEMKKKTTNYLGTGEGGELFWKNITLECLDLMDHVASYVVGEFDCHNDEQLSEVWEILIKHWYFGNVWLIKSEEVMELEIQLSESQTYKDKIPENKLFRGNPFRLFSMYRTESGNTFFKSLLTGIDCFQLDPKEMIHLSLNDGANFRRWWKRNMDYVAGKSRVIDAAKALSKTVQVIVRNRESFKEERSQIENPSVMYELKRQSGTVGAKEQNLYQEMPLIDPQRVKDMKDIFQSIYDKECEMMGFTVNSNDKKERLTVAEDYKDMRQVTNIQDWQIKNLKIFERKLKEFNWVKEGFRIEISGLTFAQGLPDTVTPSGQVIENPENNNNEWKQQEPD